MSDQGVPDPDLETLLRRQLVEARERGLLDQALHPAERRGDPRDPTGVHQARGGGEVPAHLERDDPAEPPHLPPREVVLRVALETRVVHALDLRVGLQELGDPLGVLVLARHAERQGLDAPDEEVRRERVGDRAGHGVEVPDRPHQVPAAQDRSGHQVVVAAEVLGGGVDDQIDAELDRPLVDGSRRSSR